MQSLQAPSRPHEGPTTRVNRRERTILLADCQSFYASVEKAAHPEYADRPVIVAGDPSRRTGIVLAACPLAKKSGIVAGERLGEALAKCPGVVVVQPRMQEYIRISLQITNIFESFTDLVEPYSIDEQFLDVTGSTSLFGDAVAIAQKIQYRVYQETGVRTRIGISGNKVLAKMACDNFAKKNDTGICVLRKSELASTLWPLPVNKMYMVGSRMMRHLFCMGIHTIGDLARTPLSRLKARWGINGEVLWRIANGMDDSPVDPGTHHGQRAIGHQMTLPRDYHTLDDILVVLLELCELVGRRCRAHGRIGRVVSVGCQGADFDRPSGFYRQMTMPDPTNVTDHIYRFARQLFQRHWDGLPIRKIAVALSDLSSDQEYQLTLFDDRVKKMKLEQATDRIKTRFGEAAILRAASLKEAGQARDRARKIGGHYK